MKYLMIFALLIMVVTVGLVQPVSSQMMCAGGDEVFHFTVNDIVFIGTVTAINPSNNTNRYDYITFDIKYPMKGLGNVSDFTIATYQGGSYSYDFKINSEYLVHANERLGVKYFTDLCSANQLLKTDGDVEEMKNKLLEISIPPPLKQKQYGLASHAVQCKQNLVLIQKYDGSPACVTESTKTKLIERRWTQSLPPCTSDRTACFNQESNMCDPSGWECGDNGEIFSEIISIPESKKHSTVFPYIWNDYLYKQGIEFEPRKQSYWNTGEGWLDINRVCSPIVTSNGTELYISSVFMAEPFEITGTYIDDTKPDDCHKIWKTESVLPEPDKELEAWLEIYHDKN